jgi:putative ABC transport system permease protein
MNTVANLVRLAWAYLCARPFAALLNLALLALGLGAMTFLLLVNHQIERAFERDLAGIDAVVGAKGSPMQLILSGVFHIDVPPGNVALADVRALATHPQVKKLIPVSLGDNLQGFRIVGTTHDYAAHYGAELAGGTLWQKPMQAVLGAQVARDTGLALGQAFEGSHGLAAGGHKHGELPYQVVGVLKPCACVLDRLVLTATESVWQVHEKATALDDEDQKALEAEREVTLALIQYNSPLAAVSFPRFVNTTTEMQAAAPAVEVARLMQMLGVGTQVLQGFAYVLLAVAALSVWMALANAVREREADLALMRMLGASKRKVAGLVLAEALILAVLGVGFGLLLGHGLTALLGYLLQAQKSLALSGWLWLAQEWWVLALALVVAMLAAAAPLWRAYRTDVLSVLNSRT